MVTVLKHAMFCHSWSSSFLFCFAQNCYPCHNCFSFTLSLTSLTDSLSPSLSHSLSFSHSLSLSLSLSLSPSHAFSFSLTLSSSHFLTLTHTHTLSLSLSLSLSSCILSCLFLLSSLSLCKPEGKSYPGRGFRPVRAVPVDLFPQTPHCEMITLLERVPRPAPPSQGTAQPAEQVTPAQPSSSAECQQESTTSASPGSVVECQQDLATSAQPGSSEGCAGEDQQQGVSTESNCSPEIPDESPAVSSSHESSATS